MDQILQTALARRLGEQLQATVSPVRRALSLRDQSAGERIKTGLGLGTALPRIPLDLLGLTREALDYVAKAGTGAGLAANAELNPFLKLFPDSPGARLARQALAGVRDAPTDNPVGAFRYANEAAASGNEMTVGLLNEFTNPASYLTGGGSEAARAAQKGERIASGLGLNLDLVNQLLNPEGQVLGAIGGKLAAPIKTALGAQAQKFLGAGTREVEQLPLAPDPLEAMRALLRSGDSGRNLIYAPADPAFWAKRTGVSEQEVPGLLGQLLGEGSLKDAGGELVNALRMGGRVATPATSIPTPSGPLTSDELDRLVNFAYPGRDAQANAILKYPHPDDLTEAALNRVGRNEDTLAVFARRHPDLARRLVDLPDPRLATAGELDELGLPARIPAARRGQLIEFDQGDDIIPLTARLKGTGGMTPAERAAWQERYVGRSQAGTDILATGDRVGAGELTQAELNALPPAERMAVLRRLASAGDGDLGLVPGLRRGGKWLTGSLVTGPPVNRLGVAGSGALIGGAAGGILPADNEEDRNRNRLTGAALGGGLGLGATTRTGNAIIRALPAAGRTAGSLLGEAWEAQRASMARERKGIANLPALANIWSVQTTSTLRNILQDIVTSSLWLKNAGIRQRTMWDNYASLTDLYRQGLRDGFDALPVDSQDFLARWGKTGYVPEVGESFTAENKKLIDQFSAVDTALGEGLLAAANPLQGGVPVLGAALGVAKGYTRAFQQSLYQRLDSWTKVAARHAAFQDEAEDAMAVAAHSFVDRHGLGGALDPAVGFTPQDVAALAGKAAGDEWQSQVDRVIKLGEDRAKGIFGDYANRSAGEKALGTVVPFVSWALRAYPRTAQMMLDHPGISIALTMLMFNAAEDAKESGLPSYQVGSVPIGEDVPVLGGVAKALNAGEPGEARANLLGAFNPIGGAMFAEGDDTAPDANLYQRGVSQLARTGFSPNPIIQALAYAANKDFRKPGALSRTAALEQTLPGPELPSLLAGPLDVAREAAGGSAQPATPEDRRVADLFFRATGHTISDPTNMRDPQRRQLLIDTLNPDSPIRREAGAKQLGSGLVRTILSLASPVTLSGRSDTAAAAQQARADTAKLPPPNYDPAGIAAVRRGGTVRDAIEAYLMEKNNLGTQADLPPVALINRGASGQDRTLDVMSNFTPGPGSYYEQFLLQRLLGLPTR